MKKIYLHPLPVRLWHWINAGGFIILIITGAQIRFGNIINLFSFETAVDIHSWTGFILMANYFIWLLYYLLTFKIKIYIPPLHHPIEFAKKALRQAKFYGWGIMVGDQNPHHSTPDNKFNPMQQVSYLMIMAALIPVQIITGLLLWDPKLFSPVVNLIGGIQIADMIHVLLFIFFSAFIIVHFYLATLGHTTFAHIIAMFSGYEEEYEEHEEHGGHAEEHSQ
ncbi:MAG: cytochrome B [Nitrospirae bacterium CG_4_10_14_0_8_um_filter_41_23]|nr:cytochrome B [Nitrospirota bacterium]OIP61632.1 MAG: cytochrome B [Nitrospirae bacterium CG2_30_41_42]PIQ94052.1 MAG: cytochrome B [Nitrospirae bacterium CG11_big_fil_rev_8_21_14_0_20_41_14]PIV44519.1 MAG: cytochrome B [Nitrospirae bacterium CG02_land_8_20_14_3_00_41_53]PIW87118.1 MAG: cytochrome B [Nitrospirae bacterium CG_4_8_14_3_um_filter_41_47]PIY85886.1 MAG: cytochrome B [Nitrospirae bacterium CG_4_10_14_0_8_um_filter_41_23]PJA80204.1 MAG: cytochrome B [Nitrospirae bacterium CG_4_9_1